MNMMIMIKLLAVLMLSSSVASGSVASRRDMPDIKYNQPNNWDLRVSWFYNASVGYSQLWAYTPLSGGITQQVYFTQETNYWQSFIDGGSYFESQFTWFMRIPRSTLNDDLFTLVSSGVYRFNSYDSYLSYYKTENYNLTFHLGVNDNEIYVNAKRDLNSNGDLIYAHYNELHIHDDVITRLFVFPTQTSWTFNTTFAMGGPNLNYISDFNSSVIDEYISNTTAFYVKINNAYNLESADWWDAYNQGVDAGYDAGVNDGYNDGVIDGQLANTGWQDAFMIVKGAIDTVSNVLAIELFGFFTVGTLVSIPIVVGLLFWIIEKWRGS